MKSKGFTLLETVIVALMIGIVILFVSKSYTFIYKSYGHSVDRIRMAQKEALLQRIMENKLMRIRRIYSVSDQKIVFENSNYETDSLKFIGNVLIVSGKKVNIAPVKISRASFLVVKQNGKSYVQYSVGIHLSKDSLELTNMIPLECMLPSVTDPINEQSFQIFGSE